MKKGYHGKKVAIEKMVQGKKWYTGKNGTEIIVQW